MPFLHIVRSCASHRLSPFLFMSSFTHSCHVFLPLPYLRAPSTTKSLHIFSQSSRDLRSTSPNHNSLPRLTTSTTSSTPSRTNNSSLDFLSFNVTPHIHLTIALSVLTSLSTSS